eukprot:TRINITY_DN5425_c0_g1_i1.p1 TRINITY_DN5425_c0_g1~~TRINITY_DN5425_c0_g1_i1.p1  ORF type:complete len:716 (+),score=78.59 TRINITY_DN5425_c0_g1_i1:28-2175(+)
MEPNGLFEKLLVVVKRNDKETNHICRNISVSPPNLELLADEVSKSLKIADPIDEIESWDGDFNAWVKLEDIQHIGAPPKIRLTVLANVSSATPPPVTSKPFLIDAAFSQQDGWVQKGGTDRYYSFCLKDDSKIYSASEYQRLRELLNNSLNGRNVEIKRAFAINNPRLSQNFENSTEKINSRIARNPEIFNQQNWKKLPDATTREKMMSYFSQIAAAHPHNAGRGVKVVPVVHATTSDKTAWAICQTGFASLGSTDDGYFGKGLYFSTFSEYSSRYYGDLHNGEFLLLICWVAVGNPYPCTENPFGTNSMMGKACTKGHDSHFSVVKPVKNVPECAQYVPSTQFNEERLYNELVLFEESHVMPSYVAYVTLPPLSSPLPSAPSLPTPTAIQPPVSAVDPPRNTTNQQAAPAVNNFQPAVKPQTERRNPFGLPSLADFAKKLGKNSGLLMELWQKSIPPNQKITADVRVCADLQRYHCRMAGPTKPLIQKLVDCLWQIGAAQSEIDKLNDLVNTTVIGSWIDGSSKGGINGGWYLPLELPFSQVSLTCDGGKAVKELAKWIDKSKIKTFYSVERDVGKAPAHQTEMRMLLPGADFQKQLKLALDAYEKFGFPRMPDKALAILKQSPTVGQLSLSVTTYVDKFTRIGILVPFSLTPANAQALCLLTGADYGNIVKFSASLGKQNPDFVEYQHLSVGYELLKDGFDIHFHYSLGEIVK